MKWILVIYKVPTEPSTARVYAWRKLKGLGGLYIQQSVCILPYTETLVSEVKRFKVEIEKHNGEYWYFFVEEADEEQNNKIIAQYNSLRDLEYMEIADKCNDFYDEMKRETERENFTYAELEENDDELEKLHNWFKKVVARDVFNASKRNEVESMLKKAGELLENFAQKVYNTEES